MIDTINLSNTFINKKTDEARLANIGDIELVATAMPGIFPINSRTFGNKIGATDADSCIIISQYEWTNSNYNISESSYQDIARIKYGSNLNVISNPTSNVLSILARRYSKVV